MNKISFLPRSFNFIGITLILVSLIVILIQLITREHLYGEYVSSIGFIGTLISILSKKEEDIKYKAGFLSFLLYIIVRIFTLPLTNSLDYYFANMGIEFLAIPVIYLISYFIIKYSNKQKAQLRN